jgi:hypothetical protein
LASCSSGMLAANSSARKYRNDGAGCSRVDPILGTSI